MNHYLVVFDRSRGEVLRLNRYSDRDEALRARFAEERERQDQPNIEVVVLAATREGALRRTHGRYFKSFDQLAVGAQG